MQFIRVIKRKTRLKVTHFMFPSPKRSAITSSAWTSRAKEAAASSEREAVAAGHAVAQAGAASAAVAVGNGAKEVEDTLGVPSGEARRTR